MLILYQIVFEKYTFDYPHNLPDEIRNEQNLFVEEYKINIFTILNKSKFIISDCITLFEVEKYKILFSSLFLVMIH